jgi:hypothetical protein
VGEGGKVAEMRWGITKVSCATCRSCLLPLFQRKEISVSLCGTALQGVAEASDMY